jgi:hypothetical protein
VRSRAACAVRRVAAVGLAGCLLAGCGRTAGPAARPGAPAGVDERSAAYARLIGRLERFDVSGGVHTDRGDLLPETISIEIRSEVCVESRAPGARFWSLDYDTCFVWVSRDSVGPDGEYSVGVPCLDADATYESHEKFGELRLVQRGPVTFLAESDAGWQLQDTFASSRTQRRDLVLDLRTDRFWVVVDDAALRRRPLATAPRIGGFSFGDGVDVVRFHQGWAEVVTRGKIGWIEMRCLGTQDEMKRTAPLRKRLPPGGENRSESGASP